MQRAQQFRFVRYDLLQRLAFDPWNAPSNQPVDLLSSMTATRLVACSKGMRDRLRSFCWGIRHSFGVDHRSIVQSSSPNGVRSGRNPPVFSDMLCWPPQT
jgi:hypothetical protein